MDSDWSHEESYKGGSAVALAHRNRLKHIVHLFEGIVIESHGALADFGCSNGYIISVLQQEVFRNKDWRFVRFDHAEHLLSQARAKQLESREFRFLELNAVSTDTSDRFDIVTCFETLEHTGDYRNAFVNLYQACRVGGYILVSIPNERGIPGIIKYLGRKLLRRNAYGNFLMAGVNGNMSRRSFSVGLSRHSGIQGLGIGDHILAATSNVLRNT